MKSIDMHPITLSNAERNIRDARAASALEHMKKWFDANYVTRLSERLQVMDDTRKRLALTSRAVEEPCGNDRS